MRDLTREEVIQQAIDKTMQEINAPKKPLQKSRTWQSPTGYRYLTQWSNSVLLRYLIRLFTSSLVKSEYKRKAQLDDAARSVVRNIEEGWKRSNTATYIEFVSFSQGSLEEVKGDVRDLTEDRFLPSRPGSSLIGIGINLKDFHEALKPQGVKEVKGTLEEAKDKDEEGLFLYRPITLLYPPLAKVGAGDLTYEIFMELINKTDYLLRTLVESLEKKLNEDRKTYKLDQLKIKDKIGR